MSKKTYSILFSIIAFIPVLVYLNSLENTFVYDDYLTVANNYFIRDWGYFSALFNQKYFAISNELTYRPVVTFSYFVDYTLWETKPWGFHLTNILIHTINIFLVYSFARRLVNNTLTAFISSLIFSIHPVFTETVNAISYREDLFSATFMLATFLLFIRFDRSNKRIYSIILYAFSLSAYFLALLSKEMSITLPLLIFIYDYIFTKKFSTKPHDFTKRFATHYTGYIVVSIFYLFLRFYLLHNLGESVQYPGNSIYVNLLMMFKVLGYYFKLLFIPTPLNADYIVPLTYSPDTAFIISVLLLIIIAIVSIKQFKISRIWAFSTLWFIITLLPVLNIVPINNIMAERYLYVPGIGFVILIGSIFNRTLLNKRISDHPSIPTKNNIYSYKLENTNLPYYYPKNRYTAIPPLIITLLAVIISSFSFISLNRNRIWLNEHTFGMETIRRSPSSFRMYNDIGYYYYNIGLLDEAIQAFQESIKMRFSQSRAHSNLGAAYAMKGLNDKAIEELILSIQFSDKNPSAFNNLGLLYKRKGKLDEAVKNFVEALKLNPYNAEAHINLGSVFIDQTRFDEALSEFEKAIKIRKTSALAHYNIAVVYYKTGQMDKAYNKLLEAYKLDPRNADVHLSLGILYLNHFNEKEKALIHIREALQINPNHKQVNQMKDIIKKLSSK